MGLIAATAFVLATHISHKTTIASVKTQSAEHRRLDEIWDHVDNRVITQLDLWYELGEFPECVSLLKVQSAYSPDDYDICTSLGWMLENVDQMNQARDVYRAFSDRHPEVGDAIFALGFSYFNARDYDNAIKCLEPSLAKNPSPNSYRVLAKAYERKNMPKEAIRIWELELKKYPDEGTAIANIKRVKAKTERGGK